MAFASPEVPCLEKINPADDENSYNNKIAESKTLYGTDILQGVAITGSFIIYLGYRRVIPLSQLICIRF